MRPRPIDWLAGFGPESRERAETLHTEGKLLPLLQRRYPEAHEVSDNARLYTYVQDLKRTYMKSSPPLGKVRYCEKIRTVHDALGLHSYVVRVQGKKLKRKNELRVGSVFRELPAFSSQGALPFPKQFSFQSERIFPTEERRQV